MGYNPKDFGGRVAKGQGRAIIARPREQFPQPVIHGIHQAGTEAIAEAPKTKRDRMNEWEREYDDQLCILMTAGEITYYGYEVIRIEIACNNGKSQWWTPDFLIHWRTGRIEIHEVKGYMRREDRTRIAVTAEKYPIPIILIEKDSLGQWTRKRIEAA